MTTYMIRRLLWLIPVLVVVAAITFILMHNTPGGPWDRDLSSRQVDATTQKLLNEAYGLNKPLWRQYMMYMIGDVNSKGVFVCGLICGNMGPSYRTRGRDVQDIVEHGRLLSEEERDQNDRKKEQERQASAPVNGKAPLSPTAV